MLLHKCRPATRRVLSLIHSFDLSATPNAFAILSLPPPRLPFEYVADQIADDPVTSVLYNANLLGFISEDLWDIEQVPSGLANGIRVHSLYSLAPACMPSLKQHLITSGWIYVGLLYIFPRSLSGQLTISDDIWARFEYSRRVCSTQS